MVGTWDKEAGGAAVSVQYASLLPKVLMSSWLCLWVEDHGKKPPGLFGEQVGESLLAARRRGKLRDRNAT